MEFHSIALFFHIIGGLGIFMALGILFLMTVNPDFSGSLLTIG